MNLSEQTQQKDHCNSVQHDWLVQTRVTVSDTASSTTEWVHCDSWHHWHSEQFRHQERSVKASKKENTT